MATALVRRPQGKMVPRRAKRNCVGAVQFAVFDLEVQGGVVGDASRLDLLSEEVVVALPVIRQVPVGVPLLFMYRNPKVKSLKCGVCRIGIVL